jgi:hypothetical protein
MNLERRKHATQFITAALGHSNLYLLHHTESYWNDLLYLNSVKHIAVIDLTNMQCPLPISTIFQS